MPTLPLIANGRALFLNSVSLGALLTVTTVAATGGFGQGANVLLAGSSGTVTGPALAYSASDTISFVFQINQISTSASTSNMVQNGEWSWYIDTTTKCQGLYSANAGGLGLTSNYSFASGGIARIDMTGASVTFMHSLDGGATFVTEGTQSLGSSGLTGATATALLLGVPVTPIAGWLRASKNNFLAHSVDFTNAAVGTNTTIADGVSGSWVLGGGAQILTETAPSLTMASVTLYDNAPIGTIAGTPVTSTATGTSNLSITGTAGGLFALSGANVVVASSLAGKAGQTLTGTLTLSDGVRTTTLNFTRVIGTGVNVDSSTFTNTFVTNLDNSMTGGTLGTLTCVGFTNPQVTLVMLNDERQQLYNYLGAPIPRYAVNVSGNAATVIFANDPTNGGGALSNQAFVKQPSIDGSGNVTLVSRPHDALIFTIQEGAKVATFTFVNAVAWKQNTLVICISSAGNLLSAWLKNSPNFAPGTTVTATEHYPSMNAAMDACGYGGTSGPTTATTAKYAGCTIILDDQDYSGDWNRVSIGHGNPQMWWPFPVHIVSKNRYARTHVDFKGHPAYKTQGGLGFNGAGFDCIFERIHVANVTNYTTGTGNPNAGGFYFEGAKNGNGACIDCASSGSDNDIETGGAPGAHFFFDQLFLAFGGSPNNPTLTHNAYIGVCSSVFFYRPQSLSTTTVHLVKSRSYRTTVVGGNVSDGINGRGSSCIDMPSGGIANIIGTPSCPLVLTKGANPNNDGEMIKFNEEWNVNNGTNPNSSLTVSGVKFQSLTSTTNDRPTTAVSFIGNNADASAPVLTGSVSNSTFYNIAAVNRFQSYPGSLGAALVDGGGNSYVTSWTPTPFIDPLTGVEFVEPLNGFAGPGYPGLNQADIYVPSYTTEIVFPTTTAAGTSLVTLTARDSNGAAITGGTWSSAATIGPVAISAAGVITNTLGTTPDQLCEINAQYTNASSPQNWIDQRGNVGNGTSTTKRIALIAGSGTVPAR